MYTQEGGFWSGARPHMGCLRAWAFRDEAGTVSRLQAFVLPCGQPGVSCRGQLSGAPSGGFPFFGLPGLATSLASMGFFRKSAAAANGPSSPSLRSSSGQGPPPQAPTPPAPGMQRIGVKVPPGMRPGMEIQFPTPQGPRFKAVIPPGVLEGSVFLVEVPIPPSTNGAAAAPTPAFRPPQPAPPPPPPQSSSGSFYPPFNPAPGGAGAYPGAAAVPPDSRRLARAPSNQMEEDAELQRSMARVPWRCP